MSKSTLEFAQPEKAKPQGTIELVGVYRFTRAQTKKRATAPAEQMDTSEEPVTSVSTIVSNAKKSLRCRSTVGKRQREFNAFPQLRTRDHSFHSESTEYAEMLYGSTSKAKRRMGLFGEEVFMSHRDVALRPEKITLRRR